MGEDSTPCASYSSCQQTQPRGGRWNCRTLHFWAQAFLWGSTGESCSASFEASLGSSAWAASPGSASFRRSNRACKKQEKTSSIRGCCTNSWRPRNACACLWFSALFCEILGKKRSRRALCNSLILRRHLSRLPTCPLCVISKATSKASAASPR